MNDATVSIITALFMHDLCHFLSLRTFSMVNCVCVCQSAERNRLWRCNGTATGCGMYGRSSIPGRELLASPRSDLLYSHPACRTVGSFTSTPSFVFTALFLNLYLRLVFGWVVSTLTSLSGSGFRSWPRNRLF
jgi:hypothetical protein